MNFKLPRHVLLAFVMSLSAASSAWAETTLLNVSYDPTREMYVEYNAAFAKYWKSKTGETVTIKQTHGNSPNQASSVNKGAEADVVTLALAQDIESIAANGLLSANWQQRLPHDSSPYTSTIVFLVRKGNPKNIKDWPDLTRFNINLIIPNPKTAAAARWCYLAAWGYAMKQPGGNEATAREFLKRLYANAKVMEYGARGATNTFTKADIGDVMVSWENEALKMVSEDPDKFEIVSPSISILAEPPVAVVDKMVDKHGTRKVAEAYLQYLYSPTGQEIAAKYFYRPSDPVVAAKYGKQFPQLKLFRFDELFTSWQSVQITHFQDGGIFDQVYAPYRNAS
ncbi:MAG TPA: sulfate ABC transporter substrate-binding protein [Rhodocyclaceae bacterium]|nr:sulfate ABC transporter substrate-binding protein [Rhodocyclaceae bacterium]